MSLLSYMDIATKIQRKQQRHESEQIKLEAELSDINAILLERENLTEIDLGKKVKLYAIALNSSDHWLPKVASAANRFKYMWLLLGGASLLCLVLYLMDYRDVYNHFTYMTKVKIVEEDSLEFPLMTICNDRLEPLVPFDKTSVSNRSYTDVLKIIEEKHQEILSDQRSLIEKTIASYVHETILSCTFDGEPCEGKVEKWSHYDASKGNGKCIVLKPLIRSHRKKRVFHEAGLSIEMFIESTKGTFPHDSYEMTLNLKSNPEKKIMLPVGYETDMSISETRDIQLPKPYNNCLKLKTIGDYTSELYKKTWQVYSHYNENQCMNLCADDAKNNACGCNFSRIPCLTEEQRKCADQVGSRIREERCPEDCPNACDSNSFSVILRSGKYPTDAYLDRVLSKHSLLRNKTLPLTSKNFLKLNLFYAEMKYVMIEQVPLYTFIDKLSNVGNGLSLFLGISFLYCGELINILVHLVAFVVEKYVLHRDRHEVSPREND